MDTWVKFYDFLKSPAYRRIEREPARRGAKGFDATRLKPYHRCSDGILRTEEMERAWLANGGVDHLTVLRAHLVQTHCGSVGKVRDGHICSSL